MSEFYDFNQRVHLRRDPSQWGLIGTSPTGTLYDLETRSQDVFWEHEGADIVTGEHVEDLMGDDEYRERRGLFMQAMRHPEMRVLRLALRHLNWDKGIDWRQICEIEMYWYGYHNDCCMVICDRYALVCLDTRNPALTYEGFFLTWLHVESDPSCKCEFCDVERKLSA